MNRMFLVITSLLIALLGHLALFNGLIFVFPAVPIEPKPKFFFLGPILTQNDVKEAPAKKHDPYAHRSLKHFDSSEHIGRETADPNENPFAIQAIKKPLLPQTAQAQEKITMKSTFEILPETAAATEAADKHPDPALDIRPYRPLRFRSP